MERKIMKRFIIVSVLLYLAAPITNIYGEYYMPPDKKLHLEAGIIIGAGSYFIGPALEELVFDKSYIHPVIWSIGMASLAGAGKEIIYDDKMGRGYPDKKDFYYTAAGGAISGFTLWTIESIFKCANNSISLEADPLNKKIAVSYSRFY